MRFNTLSVLALPVLLTGVSADFCKQCQKEMGQWNEAETIICGYLFASGLCGDDLEDQFDIPTAAQQLSRRDMNPCDGCERDESEWSSMERLYCPAMKKVGICDDSQDTGITVTSYPFPGATSTVQDLDNTVISYSFPDATSTVNIKRRGWAPPMSTVTITETPQWCMFKPLVTFPIPTSTSFAPPPPHNSWPQPSPPMSWPHPSPPAPTTPHEVPTPPMRKSTSCSTLLSTVTRPSPPVKTPVTSKPCSTCSLKTWPSAQSAPKTTPAASLPTWSSASAYDEGQVSSIESASSTSYGNEYHGSTMYHHAMPSTALPKLFPPMEGGTGKVQGSMLGLLIAAVVAISAL